MIRQRTLDYYFRPLTKNVTEELTNDDAVLTTALITASPQPEQNVKRPRGRPRKLRPVETDVAVNQQTADDATLINAFIAVSPQPEQQVKRPRGRPRKVTPVDTDATVKQQTTDAGAPTSASIAVPFQPDHEVKRPRGRPRKLRPVETADAVKQEEVRTPTYTKVTPRRSTRLRNQRITSHQYENDITEMADETPAYNAMLSTQHAYESPSRLLADFPYARFGYTHQPAHFRSPTRRELWSRVGRIYKELQTVRDANFKLPLDAHMMAKESHIIQLETALDDALEDAKFLDWQRDHMNRIKQRSVEPQPAQEEREFLTLDDVSCNDVSNVQMFDYLVTPKPERWNAAETIRYNADTRNVSRETPPPHRVGLKIIRYSPSVSQHSNDDMLHDGGENKNVQENTGRPVVHRQTSVDSGRLLRWNTHPRDVIAARYYANYPDDVAPCFCCTMLSELPWKRVGRSAPVRCKCARRKQSGAQRKRRRLRFLKHMSKIRHIS